MIWQHACELFFHVYVKIRLISLTAQARTHACTYAHTHTHTHTHTVTHTQMSGQYGSWAWSQESQTFCCELVLVQSSTTHFQSINSIAKLPYEKLLVGGHLIWWSLCLWLLSAQLIQQNISGEVVNTSLNTVLSIGSIVPWSVSYTHLTLPTKVNV